MQMTSAIISLKSRLYTGTHIPKVEISFVKTGGDGLFLYYKMTLTDVIITTISESGAGEVPYVAIEFSPVKVKWEYTKQKDDGTKGETLTFGWDFSLRKAF